MKSFDEWLNELRLVSTGADDAVLRNQIAATIREFFTRAIWTEELPTITLMDGRSGYGLNRIAGYDVLYLVSAKINGEPIPVAPKQPAAGQFTRSVYLDPSREQLRVYPAPGASQAGDTLTVEVAIKPNEGCTHVPDRVFTMFFDEILDGAKGRLFMMPSKPWSDRTQAAYHSKRFSAGIARARAARRSGYSSAEPEWRFPGWA